MELCSRIPIPRNSDPTSWANSLKVFAAVLVVSTALPAVSAVPQGYGYQPVYEPSYPAPASYDPPAYNPPAYSPPPYTPPSYDPPAYTPPSYEPPSYEPVYQSYDPPAYNPPAYNPPAYNPPAYNPPAYSPPAYNPPAYSPPAYTPTYYSKPTYYQEYDNYDAITYRELNASIHCGVIPATNDDLYKASKDVAPFGKYPFVVQITDDYNNFVCQGVIYQSRYVLTAKSCIYGSTDKYRVRIDDWDILTNYNEYEAYKNTEFRICDSFPVSYDSASTSYVYGPPTSELLILEIDVVYKAVINDKYPAYRHICLPTYPSYYPPSYTPPSYNPSSYSPPASYAAQPYTPPAYTPPSYPSYTPTYSECWVVGWYGSDATQLKNHPPPTEVQEAKAPSYSPAPSYGYSPSSYNPPAYTPAYEKPKYYNEYYQYYDQSKIERRAKVKEIKCPSYGYGSPAPQQGYGYGGYKDESVCFVGVEGYDACVADKGAAVFCLVPERKGYDGGYNNYDTSYESKYGYGSSPQTYYASYASYEQSYYKPDITALTSPPKQDRQRAVLYAIVQKPTSCTPQQSYGGYGSSYQQQQSKPITATKVTAQVVDAIEDNFFQNVIDLSCPAPKTYYPEPQVQYAPAYAPPAYNPPAYSPPAYVPPAYNPPAYSPPAYSPPPYTPPAYSPPAYTPPAYNPPAYTPPAYSPPAYSPPPYTPPSYNPPAYAAY